MKTFFTVLATVVLCATAAAQGRNFKHLVGKWEAVDTENQSGGLEVIDSVTIYLFFEGQKKVATGCLFNFTQSPCWFDFTIKDSTGTMALKSILSFVNDDLIQWEVFDGDTRPTVFSNASGQMVYMRRKK